MSRVSLALALLLGVAVKANLLSAAEPTEAADVVVVKAPRDLVLADPNNVKSWDAYWSEQYWIIQSMMDVDPKGAERFVDEVEGLIRDHGPTAEFSVKHVSKINGTLGAIRKSLAFYQIPLADLEKKLIENPDDLAAIENYRRKLNMELKPLARTEPAKATEQVAAVRAMYQKVKDSAQQKKAKDAIDEAVKSLASIDQEIIASRKQSDIVGQQAIAMQFEAWINGTPLTDSELKGKVILIDFWAVWCGPCIASFPTLKKWQDEYGDKGLVIIGATKYYNFRWDDANKKPAKSDDEVSPEDEQAMLKKFAESHGLKHRFAVHDGGELDDFYAVRGIPQFVVIDQQNKVRLIRVGSGEATDQEISALLKELLGEKPATK
jgi:thiol-disulfide isomerase/thioredoxin